MLINDLPSTSTLMTFPAISPGKAQEIHANRISYLLFKQEENDRNVDFMVVLSKHNTPTQSQLKTEKRLGLSSDKHICLVLHRHMGHLIRNFANVPLDCPI